MMGGYGAPIIFGGTWILVTICVAAAKNAWSRWNSPHERRLVRMPTVPSNDILKSLGKSTDNIIFGSAMALALIVYYVKSWRQARRGPKTKDD